MRSAWCWHRLAFLLGGLALCLGCLGACRSSDPAERSKVEAEPLDALGQELARFRVALDARYAAYSPVRDEALRRGTPMPVFDISDLLEKHFPPIAAEADRGDPRALLWCLEQMGWTCPVTEGALRQRRPDAWWTALLAAELDDEAILRVTRMLPSMGYLLEDKHKGLIELEQRAREREVKARVLACRISLLAAPDSATEQRELRQRLVSEYADTVAGVRAAADTQRDSVLQVGQPFPGFAERRFVDLERASASSESDPERLAANGATFRLGDLKARFYVLIFWDHRCGFCLAELPLERELHSRFTPLGVEFVGVYTDPDLATFREQSKTIPVPWRNAWDVPGKMRAGPVCRDLGLYGVPFTLVLDSQGIVRTVNARGEQLGRAIEAVVSSPTREGG